MAYIESDPTFAMQGGDGPSPVTRGVVRQSLGSNQYQVEFDGKSVRTRSAGNNALSVGTEVSVMYANKEQDEVWVCAAAAQYPSRVPRLLAPFFKDKPASAMLVYLMQNNPRYFTYRTGVSRGAAGTYLLNVDSWEGRRMVLPVEYAGVSKPASSLPAGTPVLCYQKNRDEWVVIGNTGLLEMQVVGLAYNRSFPTGGLGHIVTVTAADGGGGDLPQAKLNAYSSPYSWVSQSIPTGWQLEMYRHEPDLSDFADWWEAYPWYVELPGVGAGRRYRYLMPFRWEDLTTTNVSSSTPTLSFSFVPYFHTWDYYASYFMCLGRILRIFGNWLVYTQVSVVFADGTTNTYNYTKQYKSDDLLAMSAQDYVISNGTYAGMTGKEITHGTLGGRKIIPYQPEPLVEATSGTDIITRVTVTVTVSQA